MHWGTVPTPAFITEKYCSLIVDCSWMSETTILVSVTSFMLGTMGLDVFTLILLLLVVIIIVVINHSGDNHGVDSEMENPIPKYGFSHAA